MNLPFQAVECYLDGVYPYPGMMLSFCFKGKILYPINHMIIKSHPKLQLYDIRKFLKE